MTGEPRAGSLLNGTYGYESCCCHIPQPHSAHNAPPEILVPLKSLSRELCSAPASLPASQSPPPPATQSHVIHILRSLPSAWSWSQGHMTVTISTIFFFFKGEAHGRQVSDVMKYSISKLPMHLSPSLTHQPLTRPLPCSERNPWHTVSVQ